MPAITPKKVELTDEEIEAMEFPEFNSDVEKIRYLLRIKSIKSSIHKSIRTWNWFVEKLIRDEEERNFFSKKDFSKDEFYSQLRKRLQKVNFIKFVFNIQNFPNDYRRKGAIQNSFLQDQWLYYQLCLTSKLAFSIVEGRFGIKVITKTTIKTENKLKNLFRTLFGWVIALDSDIMKIMQKMKISTLTEEGYMIGPLQFVNHECDHLVHFEKRKHGPKRFKKLKKYQMIYLQSEDDLKYKKNEEILCRYSDGKPTFFICKCKKCKKK